MSFREFLCLRGFLTTVKLFPNLIDSVSFTVYKFPMVKETTLYIMLQTMTVWSLIWYSSMQTTFLSLKYISNYRILISFLGAMNVLSMSSPLANYEQLHHLVRHRRATTDLNANVPVNRNLITNIVNSVLFFPKWLLEVVLYLLRTVLGWLQIVVR